MKHFLPLPLALLLMGVAVGDSKPKGLSGAFSGVGGTKASSAGPILPTPLTINGITVTPTFAYLGQNASPTLWTATVGPNLPVASTGAAPVTGVATASAKLTALKGVTLSSTGQVYQAGSTTAQIGAGDIVIEAYVQGPPTTAGTIACQRGGTTDGWYLGYNSTTQEVSSLGPSFVFSTAPISANTWFHVMVFINRRSATGWQTFINGTLATTADPTGAQADFSLNNLPFTIGSLSTFGAKGAGTVAVVYVWTRANWFAGGTTDNTQFAAAAAARYALY